MRVCDNCKRPPEEFYTDKNEKAYWLVVPKESGEVEHLMSNLEYCFAVCKDRNPPDDPNNDLICSRCADSILESEE